MTPSVSIVLSVYNGEKYIAQTINSVLSQSHRDFELIISNNGSSDNTLKIINEYSFCDSRIIVFDHDNIGFSNSLNASIDLAKSNIIVRMDADDIMKYNRIEEQLRYLSDNPCVSVASCLAEYIAEDGKVIGKTYSDLVSVQINKIYFEKNEPVGILHPGAIFYKDIFLQIGGYRGDFFPAEDIDLWQRFNESGFWVSVQQKILMEYRIVSSSSIFSGYLTARLKFEWVRECMLLRRSGRPEISWYYFLECRKKLPFLIKINKNRKNYAKFFYRKAGFNYGCGDYFSFILKLLFSFVLQPSYVLKRIFNQRFNFN
jgi:glycosyltransferase involved in cell wall biosynthesis